MNPSLRIVVADDEALIRQYFQEILPDLGHEVVAACRTGTELVEMCRAARPDLVISDIKMPDMDGIEAASLISREQPIPIILVSAYHDPELLARAGQSHIMAYLVKPVERANLEAAIAIVRSRFDQFQELRREAHENKQALEDRKTVEKAKGVMMKKTRLEEPEAFRTMQKMARDRNLKLVEVARLILESDPDSQTSRRRR